MELLIERAAEVAKLSDKQVQSPRFSRLSYWTARAAEAESERSSWLASLPSHARDVYLPKFNGPLFKHMHRYLVNLGYTDTSLFDDICNGMPSGVVLPSTGL